MKLHLLQSSRHFGAETGSSTSSPTAHSGQASTPCCAGECLQVGCRQVVQGIPSFTELPPPVSACSKEHGKGPKADESGNEEAANKRLPPANEMQQ